MSQFQLRQINVQFPPASGATFTVYRQGATVSFNSTITFSSTMEVRVFDIGRVQIGDTLVSSTNPGLLFYVNDVSPDRIWLGVQSSTWPVTIPAGARLVPSSPPPTLYADAAGTTALPSNVLTLDAQGRATFYYIGPLYDGVLSSGGELRFLIDQGGGIDTRLADTVSVLDYPSFQAAHDALPATGGVINVPPGTYSKDTVPSFKGLVVTKPVAIIGVSNGQASALSILFHDDPSGSNTDSIFLNVAGDCLIKNLFIMRPLGTVGTGRGIRWYKSGPAGTMVDVTLDNVTVWRSPNWSFEFLCDGYQANYVSKLVMLDCTAFEAASGGSLHLGGAGSNNNFFTRCEFDGPGFGAFFNVDHCLVQSGLTTVFANGPETFTGIAAGDEVSGLGIAIGTKVLSVDSPNPPNPPVQLTLDRPAIETPPNPPPTPQGLTRLTFWRDSATPYPGDPLRRGHVHLMRTSACRFIHCAFQGPASTPVLSTDLPSNDLVLRDCYREREAGGTADYSFLMNSMSNFLIDGLYHQFHEVPSMLLNTGPGGLGMGRITNAQLLTTSLTGTAVVRLLNPTDELAVDDSMEVDTSGVAGRRGLVVAGPGAVLQQVIWDHQYTLSLPNGSDDVFLVVGDGQIGTISALRPKQRVTLVFTGNVGIQNGQNLRLNGNFQGTSNSTISLVCDGTNWIEICRSPNLP